MKKGLTTNVQELFDNAKRLIGESEYKKASSVLKQLVNQDDTCLEAWSNLGLAYCQQGEYDKAVDAYNKIPVDKMTARTWFNIGIAEYYRHWYRAAVEAYEKATYLDRDTQHENVLSEAHFNLGVLHFEIGDIASATRHVGESLQYNEHLASAWALKGRISIENNDCDDAIKNFERAIALDYAGDLTFLIWEAYARYLNAEFLSPSDRSHQLVSVIRKLERVDTLADKLGRKDIRAHALYFLACFYCKQEDHLTSKKKLEECIRLKTKTPLDSLAQELLENLWDKKIRPPWWRWWITATSMRLRLVKTVIFVILTALAITMILILFAHPFIDQIPYIKDIFPKDSINWNVYLFTVALLIIIILSPSIEQIKTKDMEIKVQAPISLEIIPSSAQMERALGAMRRETIITTIE